jgi:hypothetical protein
LNESFVIKYVDHVANARHKYDMGASLGFFGLVRPVFSLSTIIAALRLAVPVTVTVTVSVLPSH